MFFQKQGGEKGNCKGKRQVKRDLKQFQQKWLSMQALSLCHVAGAVAILACHPAARSGKNRDIVTKWKVRHSHDFPLFCNASTYRFMNLPGGLVCLIVFQQQKIIITQFSHVFYENSYVLHLLNWQGWKTWTWLHALLGMMYCGRPFLPQDHHVAVCRRLQDYYQYSVVDPHLLKIRVRLWVKLFVIYRISFSGFHQTCGKNMLACAQIENRQFGKSFLGTCAGKPS